MSAKLPWWRHGPEQCRHALISGGFHTCLLATAGGRSTHFSDDEGAKYGERRPEGRLSFCDLHRVNGKTTFPSQLNLGKFRVPL